MGFFDWLKGKPRSQKRTALLKFDNPGRMAADIRVVGGQSFTLRVPEHADDMVRVPPGKYHIRFQIEDEFEIYQGDEFAVEAGSVMSFSVKTTANDGQRIRPVKGPL
jgi:hypothetical protein